MIGLNGYTISTGVFPKYLHGDDILSIPLEVDEKIQVGTIMHKNVTLTHLGKIYLESLKKNCLSIYKFKNRLRERN